MAIQVVILAAGQGKRMFSSLPKVLHRLAGKPMLDYVVHAAKTVAPQSTPVVVIGHQGEQIREACAHLSVHWIEQLEQRGTGHALMQALPALSDDAQILVLYGDVPLVNPATLKRLMDSVTPNAIAILTAELNHPTGYGRIKRDAAHRVIGIVEEKDATPLEKAIKEVNSGIYVVPATYLKKWLPQLKNQNAQSEYYLTDIIHFALKENITIHTVSPEHHEEIFGVNDCAQLARLERYYQQQLAEQWMQKGVTLADPARFDIRGEVKIGQDVTIDVNVILEGKVIIGNHCVIGAHVILHDTELHDGVQIKPHSLIEGATIGAHSIIGPFVRIRPGTVLAANVHIGNFVEVKNSQLGEGTKANHLSYLGDSEIGKRVNIGAGTITCNYDGANKHKTFIGDDVHIGSDTQLVAPVNVGKGATIAAGSTLTQDAPPDALTVTQKLDQRVISGWKRPVKKRPSS